MNSAIFRRNTRKSYGGSIHHDLKAQENVLKKLQANLKWKNVRQFTHNQRAALPQKVANQQKIVNELRQQAATATQNSGILSTITQKVNDVVNTIKNNVTKANNAIQSAETVTESVNAAKQANIAANAALKQSQNLKKLANNAEQIAKNLRELKGGSRRKRRNTYRK